MEFSRLYQALSKSHTSSSVERNLVFIRVLSTAFFEKEKEMFKTIIGTVFPRFCESNNVYRLRVLKKIVDDYNSFGNTSTFLMINAERCDIAYINIFIIINVNVHIVMLKSTILLYMWRLNFANLYTSLAAADTFVYCRLQNRLFVYY